ncbi:hypothetical protein QNA08_03080 [Chelatococcus sp. SYSU_G07232]|uniref:Uncharacterized protein n=1 Tax=Chelatococcus albus TaxID=3047466 RepID=A0ABT7AD11_9HYPH|nr:hypothetical protein [Chelatococcus sp. SYSU_G07232]MDJ1157223.1 hypothetical protein [Chelatococcus sp. SYSU_G07232]
MPLRPLRLAAVILALAAWPNVPRASAQDITAEGVARSYSLFAVLGEVCARFYPVDPKRVEAYKATFKAIGADAFGAEAYSRALASELPRRHEEVTATGEERWCMHQKRDLAARGAKDLFL